MKGDSQEVEEIVLNCIINQDTPDTEDIDSFKVYGAVIRNNPTVIALQKAKNYNLI